MEDNLSHICYTHLLYDDGKMLTLMNVSIWNIQICQRELNYSLGIGEGLDFELGLGFGGPDDFCERDGDSDGQGDDGGEGGFLVGLNHLNFLQQDNFLHCLALASFAHHSISPQLHWLGPK